MSAGCILTVPGAVSTIGVAFYTFSGHILTVPGAVSSTVLALYAFSGHMLTVPGAVSSIGVTLYASSDQVLTVPAAVSSTGAAFLCILRSHSNRHKSCFLDRDRVFEALGRVSSTGVVPRSRSLDRDCVLGTKVAFPRQG